MAGQLVKEYYGMLVIFGVIMAAILAGVLTPQYAVTMPSLWFLGIMLGVVLMFIIPFVASVRFHSPNIFDGDGSVWSFNEEQMFVAPMFGTQMAVIASGGFDNPKKVLAHENISSGRTILLAIPARLVESVGHGRFLVLRASLNRLGYYENRAFLSHPAVQDQLERWGVKHATTYMSIWTKTNLLPPTGHKPRVDFDRISSYMSKLRTELGIHRGTVEETWRRERAEAERTRRSTPPQPVQIGQSETKEEK